MNISTTFFNNEEYYLDNYIKWYSKLYNVEQFIFFIGKKDIVDFNFFYPTNHINFTQVSDWHKHGINFFKTTSNNIVKLFYKSNNNTTEDWHCLKLAFWDILKNNFYNPNTLWTDCDELLYVSDINQALTEGYIKTHFYEYIPKHPFSLDSETLWSVCPWYYREQALSNRQNINHHNCKIFNLRYPQETKHMGHISNSYCNSNYTYKDYTNVCWHVGVHSREHYFKGKHWLQTDPNGRDIWEQDRISGVLKNSFEKYHIECEFPTFNINLKEVYKI